MKTVAIFGAGIAGLTVAHELSDKGFQVHLYEKSKDVGGFAKSKRVNIPSQEKTFPVEHSWRGYAPFYFNAFDVMKNIPCAEGSVYDNLTYPVHFLLPRDRMRSNPNKIGEPVLSAKDVTVLGYHISKVMFSSPKRRKEVYAKQSFKNILYPQLSQDGKDKIFGMIGPGLGLDLYTCSMYDVVKYAEMRFLTNHKPHMKYNRVGWHVMNAPTSEAWFDHWKKYLLEKGVNIYPNTELIDIITHNSSIEACIIRNKGEVGYVHADDYILAINPFNLRDIIRNNILLKKDVELEKFEGLCADGEHKQIAFQIALDKKVHFGKVFSNSTQETYAVAFPDSEFNITLYPQDKQFSAQDLPTPGYWSGTACICTRPGRLYNLPALSCTKEQFIREVKHQIFRSEEFKMMIEKWNYPLTYKDFNITQFIVYDEWKFPPCVRSATETERKWVTTINTERYRPGCKCEFDNLFLSGAHITTSVSLWSMEGAVESGKMAANCVLEKYNAPLSGIHIHNSPKWMSAFHVPDSALYNMKAPHILVICAIIIMIVMYVIYSYLKNTEK
ncbi:MAG TPA: FAD-dependent oxidoreductase [Nitrosarchaeum sp.]|nr:FAD-dependent oxidoreductase [Nitrosarchaeum sp.]